MSERVNEHNRSATPTRTQVSAGGIVYRCTDAGELEVILIATQLGERWGLPKGQVEEGETLQETAVREVREETGLDADIVEELTPIEYWYWWTEGTQKVRYHKRVHFFLMECRGGDLTRHDFEVADVRWYGIDAAIKASSYDSERRLLEVARSRLTDRC